MVISIFRFISLIGCGLFMPLVFASSSLGTPDPDDIEYPMDEAPSAAEIELGKTLFFDTRLSANQTQSCATCHNPDLGFGDGMAKGLGSEGNQLGRNTPHLYNLAWSSIFFWDGRSATLEDQALGPIEAAGEMNMPLDKLLPRLQQVAYYREQFKAVYQVEKIEPAEIGAAIAAFERSIVSADSAFDKYLAGNLAAMAPVSIRGMQLFEGKARCTQCHDGPNFTDDSFHNVGLGTADPGRQEIVHSADFAGAFKTPGLRNVALTSPYFHDGSAATLEAVVRYYNRGGDQSTATDKLIIPLGLNDQEIMELVAFLGALTSPVNIDRPLIP